MKQSKIKLVVVDNHTLGYIFPEHPKTIHVLSASIFKGSPHPECGSITNYTKNVRLASEKDFEDFKISFNGYKNSNDYEYETKCFVQNINL